MQRWATQFPFTAEAFILGAAHSTVAAAGSELTSSLKIALGATSDSHPFLRATHIQWLADTREQRPDRGCSGKRAQRTLASPELRRHQQRLLMQLHLAQFSAHSAPLSLPVFISQAIPPKKF